MLNDYISPVTNRRVLLVEILNHKAKRTYQELARDLKIRKYQVVEVINVLREHYGLEVDMTRREVTAKMTTAQMCEIRARIYNDDNLMRYLQLFLKNEGKISMVAMEMQLNISQSMAYKLRHKANKVLASYDLVLTEKGLTGSELNLRLLIALLEIKFQVPIYTDYRTEEKLALAKFIVQTNPRLDVDSLMANQAYWQYFERLVAIGKRRAQYDREIKFSDQLFLALEKDEFYQRFQKDLQQSEYFHQPGYVLCPGTVCYLLYVYLLTDNPLYGSLGDDNPEIITRFYGYLLRNPNYQALDQLLREKYQVQPDVSLQMNILELYAETLAGGDRFHLESYLETEANEKMDIYPPLKHAICQDLEHCLNYRVQNPVCRSFALNLQNYYLRHLKLGCRIVIADDSPLLYESVAKLQGYFIGKNDQLISFSPRQNKLSELQTKAPQIICAAPRVFEFFRGRDFGPYTELYYIVPNRALYILPKLRKYKYESDRRQLAYELDKILAVD